MVHGDKYKWSLRFITVNLTNKVALSTISYYVWGTHYVHRGATQPNWDLRSDDGRWGWRPARGKPAAVWLPRS